MCFHCDKGVEGVALMSEFQNFPINSMTLPSFMLLKGFVSMFERANVSMTGADGGLCLKRRKKLDEIFKNVYD